MPERRVISSEGGGQREISPNTWGAVPVLREMEEATKTLYWEEDGFPLLYKCLESGSFQ